MLIFSAQYQGSAGRLERFSSKQILLWLVPALTICLVWTNELHHLVWRQVGLIPFSTFQILRFDYGPWFWVVVIYSYCMVLMGSIWLLTKMFHSKSVDRRMIGLALIGILIPWTGNLIYITNLNPLPGLDWTPFASIVACIVLTISLYRFHLLNISPIAHKDVFNGLADMVLVLDLHDCIVDLNPAAQQMIGEPGQVPSGRPFAEYLPEIAASWENLEATEEFQAEMPYGNGPNLRFYNLEVSPLFNHRRAPVGRLVTLRDITQHKRDQAQLEKARDDLEKQVSEQIAEIEQRNRQLQNELNQRMLAEKRFEDVVESAPDAMIVIDQDSAIRLVNAQAERLFGFSREELLCQSIGELVVMRHREESLQLLQQYLSNPLLRPVSYETDVAGLRKDGSEFPVEVSLGPLKTTEGMWVSINVRDISKRKLAEAEQNRLLEEIRQSSEQLSALAARLEEVQEIERRQLSCELHDRVGQNLTGLNLNLQVIQNQLSQEADPAIRSRLIDSLKLVEETTRQVRDVMADLRPPGLDEYGLFAALRSYSVEFSGRTGTETVVVGDEITPRLPPSTETVLFRLVQEALNNAAKHAQATRVVIRIESTAEVVCLSVEDNGIGFDPQDRDRQDDKAHWGIITMQQRAASIGAQLSIDSSPGRGTTIFICVPR